MKFELKIESRARNDIQSLDRVVQKRVAKKLKFYLNQDDPIQHAKKLVDSKDGNYQWRIGNFRAVFDIDGNVIKLLRVQHRKDVYK
ncbi:MAG: type II toxin-antitoxin system RelE/ParE family toxin [bacterium]